MESTTTKREIEEHLGQVPSFIEALADPTVDHSWGLMRDLQLAETDLPNREKALVGFGAAVATHCPYCIHFHKEEAKLHGVSDEELKEAVSFASMTQYYSTVIHGSEIEMDEFVEETAEIMDHVKEQHAAAGDD